MRTKTLLWTAATLAAGFAGVNAQSVYSVNAVGYINLSLPVGYSMIANQLNGTNNNLSTILPVVPDGTVIVKWDPVLQNFTDPNGYFEGFGWSPDGVLNPGEGAFINVPTAATVTFVGEVPQGALTNALPVNYSMKSSIVPQTIGLTAAGFPADDGDVVLFWDPVTQNYGDPYGYFEGFGWSPSEPTPAVGQSFFVNKTIARSWTRNFSVN